MKGENLYSNFSHQTQKFTLIFLLSNRIISLKNMGTDKKLSKNPKEIQKFKCEN
jgi:hypothetical protein